MALTKKDLFVKRNVLNEEIKITNHKEYPPPEFKYQKAALTYLGESNKDDLLSITLFKDQDEILIKEGIGNKSFRQSIYTDKEGELYEVATIKTSSGVTRVSGIKTRRKADTK